MLAFSVGQSVEKLVYFFAIAGVGSKQSFFASLLFNSKDDRISLFCFAEQILICFISTFFFYSFPRFIITILRIFFSFFSPPPCFLACQVRDFLQERRPVLQRDSNSIDASAISQLLSSSGRLNEMDFLTLWSQKIVFI